MDSNNLTIPYLVLAGVIVVSLGLIVAYLQPAVREIQGLRETITTLRARQVARADFLRTLDAKVAALARESQHEKQLNVVLPAADEHKDVVRLIHQAQLASGGVVQNLSNTSAGIQSSLNASRARGDATPLPENIVPLGLELEFSGSYQQLRIFLDQLVRAPRLLDITSLEIRRNAEALDTIGSTLTINFYRYQLTED